MNEETVFLDEITKLIDKFEGANQCIVGCLVTLPSNEGSSFFQWNGERMVKEEGHSIEIVKNEGE